MDPRIQGAEDQRIEALESLGLYCIWLLEDRISMQLQGTYVNFLSESYCSGGCHCTVSIAIYTTGVIHAILSILQGHRKLLRRNESGIHIFGHF